MSDLEVQQMVMYHNGYRAAVAVPDITWDVGLAFDAQQWADTLAANGGNLTHSEVRGENLFGGSGKAFSPGDVVNSWGNEKDFYSGQAVDAQNVETFGHYTQMVWSTTTNVGCGVATAANGTMVWVCRYSPAGNIIGEKPY